MKVAVLLGEITGRGGMESALSKTVEKFNRSSKDRMKLFILGGSVDQKWLSNIVKDDYFLLSSARDMKLKRYIRCITVAPKKIVDFAPDIILAADEKSVLYSLILRKLCLKNILVGSWIHFSLTSLNNIYQNLLHKLDFHLAISEGLRKELIALGVGKSKIYLVYNPVDVKSEMVARPLKQTHILYIGRLIYDGQKRVNDLLNACAKLTGDWKLTVIGDGSDKEKLQDLSEKLKISPKINWLGWQEEPFDCIQDASTLVLTSNYEGFGLVLVEAMSRGIPCISSDCPVGPSDIIKRDVNGWLYPVGKISELTSILQKLINSEIELFDPRIVKNSVQKYDIDIFNRNLKDALLAELRKQTSG